MPYDILVKEAKELPEDMIEQAIEFIRFLKYASEKKRAKNPADNDIIFHRSVNPLAGELIAIADDFDQTPDCFKEYI